ncbi:hypothetical protein FOA52_009631 [Chlamydomonas sp. UWO 241]|nr:hypothetical protein FOA52_009631 [Chlamydomonas sp. UWO 241]
MRITARPTRATQGGRHGGASQHCPCTQLKPSRSVVCSGSSGSSSSSSGGDELSSLIQELSALPGVRVQFEEPRRGRRPREEGDGGVVGADVEDDDDDDDNWGDIMEELEDPWMANPVADPDDKFAGLLGASEGEGGGGVVGSDSASPPASAYDGISLIGRMKLLVLMETAMMEEAALMEAQARAGAGAAGGREAEGAGAAEDGAGGSGSGSGSSSGAQAIVLIDVRAREEFDDGHVPGCANIPLGSLTGDAARTLVAGSRAIVVIGSGEGDTRSAQACVRLARVYGAKDVMHYEAGTSGYARHEPLQQSGG